MRVVLPALLLLAACGPGGPVETMRVEQVVTTLVTEPGRLTVHQENPEHPVVARTMAPSNQRQFDSSPLPSLQLTPPARVEIDLGGLPPDAELRFAIGSDAAAFEGPAGKVRVTATWGEHRVGKEWVHEPGVPAGQRVWARAAGDLAGADVLVLTSELVEGSAGPGSVAVGGLEVVVASERERERATTDQPNVVVVVIDTLRADALHTYGAPREVSPHLDALAARGTLFESAWAATPWTWPSTASLLTSLSPPEHGLLDYTACYLSHRLETLPERLQREGWTTGGFSSNPLVRADKGFDQGFETFHEYTWAHAGEVLADVEPWLRANAERRFFAYVHLTDPHEYRPQEPFAAQFADPMPQGYTQVRWMTAYDRALKGEGHDPALLAADTAYNRSLYDATVAEADAAVGRIVELLEELGRSDDTLVVVTSDHGEGFLEHGLLLHASNLHAEMVRVPFLLAGPGVPVGARHSERVENRFLAPTLFGLLDLEEASNLEGPDLLDERQRTEAAGVPFFFTTNQGIWPADGQHPDLRRVPLHGVWIGDELFHVTLDAERPARALYDLAADPDAQVDLAAGRAQRCDQLERMIHTWLEKGMERCPLVLDGGQSALELLQAHGYAGDD